LQINGKQYSIPETNPKEYKALKSDETLSQVFRVMKKIELFLTLEDTNNMRSANNVSHRRLNPPRASTTPKSSRKETFLYLSESFSDGKFPTNEDNKYVNEENLKDVRIDYGNEIENQDPCSDQADDCYAENEYHSPRSSDNDSEANGDVIYDIEAMQMSVWEMNYDDPVIEVEKMLKKNS